MDSGRQYQQDLESIKNFFTQNTEKYGPILTEIANRDRIKLDIDLADIDSFNSDLSRSIVKKANRYLQLFYEALDELLPSYQTKEALPKDNLDIIIQQRLRIARENAQQANIADPVQAANGNLPDTNDIDNQYPRELIRRVEVYFTPSDKRVIPVREVLAHDIGHLISIRGLVTRCSEIKSQAVVATYTCAQCGCETFQPIHEPEITPLSLCSSAACKSVKNPGTLKHHVNTSRFVKAQEIKLQELSDQVPTGDIPRTIKVLAHGELTRSCNAGDQILLSGIFLTCEKTGFRQAGHASDVYIEAQCIKQMSKSDDQEYSDEPMSMEEASILINDTPDFYNRISSSIAPEIFGHVELKKALLLLLIGGVEKIQSGARTRGDINICLMGDPGVAKSQLLRFVDRLATRSQYTTGRGSSGVGLTAAVMRDPVTEEVTLEGGALVLADRGVCCIDEFDKMMDADRTAIHEVMEQQTVSIAKAGINTTLNARVSILAAANPTYGRYNIYRSIADNLRLPPALLSRFDLIWLIKDHTNTEKDTELAKHVTNIHTNPEAMSFVRDAIDMKIIRRYINLCKTKNPFILPAQAPRLCEIFLEIRKKKRPIDKSLKEDTLFTSPRSLLAIARIATAFARLRLAENVDIEDIENAVKLYESSKKSIEGFTDPAVQANQEILDALRRLSNESSNEDGLIKFDDLHKAIDSFISEHSLEEYLERLVGQESITYNKESRTILYLSRSD